MILNIGPYRMNKIKFFAICVAVFITNNTFSQVHDLQLWNEFSVDKELIENLSLHLKHEFRIGGYVTMLDETNTDFGVGYKFNKYLRVRAFYRFSAGDDNKTGLEKSHKLYTDIIGRYKLNQFTFSVRERYQTTFSSYDPEMFGSTPVHYLRSKLSVKYAIYKTNFSPNISVELFHSLNNPMGNSTDRKRFTAGVEYNFNKKLSAEIYYMFQQRRVSYRKPTNTYVIGTGINYSF